MEIKTNTNTNIKLEPYLMRYSVLRTSERELPGYYSPDLDVWVLDQDKSQVPVINVCNRVELTTKTKVGEEQDDQCLSFLETITKTDVQQERDDSDLEMNHLLELTTKTNNNSESDDNSMELNHFLELTTKTRTFSESDDNADIDLLSSPFETQQ
jgi:hypothetical protein